ncbi:pilus motility taxis protein HmpF [Nostoc sp. UHCC 0870]|uniref:pilus motility taxis protein HmpF n=1 Tax=Nostoc sp. UHCC 0870 TaxID=2914041 RepID=UPI001EDCB9FC|nr:pilus motility taxis protein HmpF [Nostoc sp. UHCC 0870]UKO96051.1 pilus motility taxis protein HmpF [Nostoc sp. UHCC 0870]
MLYLAEVQKQKGGLLSGSSKTELKLLACQRTDQNWSPVSEDVIAAEEASKLNDGALVLVEVTPNRQVQRIQEASRPLVNILQNFSRQLEKYKLKEDEIDQWKESLTFQAQELNRREMDMEVRLEQLQNMEEEFQRLESQQQEVDTSRAQIEQLQTEIERNREELEGAWEHLRGEQNRLEERLREGGVLDEAQSRKMSELLDRLSSRIAPIETLREHLQIAFELVEKQQATLNPHWEKFTQQKTIADQQQQEVEQLAQTYSDRQNTWQQAQNTLDQQTTQFKVNTATLASKQEQIQIIKQQLQSQDDLYQRIYSLAATSGCTFPGQKIDVQALENMSLGELQKTIQDLLEKLEIDSSFVHDQEQELKYKQETIEELQSKMNQASGQDLINLQTEIADEQDLYQMLNETLVGQRRNLLMRQQMIKQHQNILLRRQGQTVANAEEENSMDFSPILSQMEQHKQQQLQELQRLGRDIEQMRAALELDQGMIDNQTHDLQQQQQELKTMEENLRSLRTANAEFWGRVNLYQETVQPIQDCLDELRSKLQSIGESLGQIQETGDYQLQTITEIRHTIGSLLSQQELLAS